MTTATTLTCLYRNQFRYLADRGFEIVAVCDPEGAAPLLRREPIRLVPIHMAREPSPLRDLSSVVRLWWFLLRHRFDIVHVSTPKAALLGSIAARLSGHRRVINTLRGRAYENDSGARRRLFAALDSLAFRLARRVNPIAFGLGDQIVREGLCPREKVRVIADGSSNGIDLHRFSRTPAVERQARALRQQLGIDQNDPVILCMGRIRREKGINELVRAFAELAEQHLDLQLLLVGRYEDVDPVEPGARDTIGSHPRIHHLEWQAEPTISYAAADILAFPTYREGFGNVALEAAAMQLPVVASDIVGCQESVQRNVTGLLVPMQDVPALRDALDRLIRDPDLRRRLGSAGRERVERRFRQEVIWEALIQQYDELLSEHGRAER